VREIEFRGKKVYNSEWVYGDLRHGSLGLNTYINGRQVTTETIGQYTGLLDKNGKKIYEGDVTKHHRHGTIGYWYYSEKYLAFVMKDQIEGERFYFKLDSDYLEVVGNIHDNPELLKEEQE
jgi:uncharacterized phage protein (TIGR01671 family)